MRFALALSFALAGCASTPPPEPTPQPEPEAPAAKVVWSVPMVMEQGIPVITARVRDGETKFAIATSSSNHTLTKAFASSVRAPVSTTRQTTRVHGAATEVEKVEGVVSIKAANADWRLEQVVAANTQALDPRGIGGLLVPQALADNTTTVVLDFKAGAITLVEGDPSLFETWFRGKFGESQKLDLQREGGLLYVDATVGDAGTKRARLDSASARSRFAAADLGAEIAADACVEGADLIEPCLPGAPATVTSLALGPQTFPAWEALAVPSGEAVIGIDILSSCVIAIGVGNQAHIVCD